MAVSSHKWIPKRYHKWYPPQSSKGGKTGSDYPEYDEGYKRHRNLRVVEQVFVNMCSIREVIRMSEEFAQADDRERR